VPVCLSQYEHGEMCAGEAAFVSEVDVLRSTEHVNLEAARRVAETRRLQGTETAARRQRDQCAAVCERLRAEIATASANADVARRAQLITQDDVDTAVQAFMSRGDATTARRAPRTLPTVVDRDAVEKHESMTFKRRDDPRFVSLQRARGAISGGALLGMAARDALKEKEYRAMHPPPGFLPLLKRNALSLQNPSKFV
jgi:hypothetical protein